MATGLPAGWEVRHSNSKNLPYYFNPQTKESRWEPPLETDSETLKHYMGQYHTTNLRADGVAQQDLGGKIRCAHLLVKHQESRRPSSWREAQITRSKDDAYGIIQNYYGRINSGATSLGDLATTESDCPSARKRGDLGFFGKGEMQKEFEEASFVLKPGEVSPVIETASGLHIIESIHVAAHIPLRNRPETAVCDEFVLLISIHTKMQEPRGARYRNISIAGHRLPFWAKTATSLKIYMDNPRPKRDFDLMDHYENFSYLSEHFSVWLAPDGLLESLPTQYDGPRETLETAQNWQKAAAALSSALQQLDDFSRGAQAAAYPPHGPSRRNSEQTVSGAKKPCDSPFTTLPPPLALGMESPPYTPFDNSGSCTPLNCDINPQKAVDPKSLHHQLSPLSIADDFYPTRPRSDEGFNEVSWEYFVERHASFMLDCRIALQRVKGYARTIEILLTEQKLVLTPEVKLVVMEFDGWWAGMKPKAEALDERVKGLEAPSLMEVVAVAASSVAEAR
ncbi:hypothetical protein B0A55_12891 [Friedmanniomyces simplex]|uniref:peptidylprolyl isomerase n=1 Tax=Friedmanniomyces simplex TaxID=329884 RepID=A0A4U0VQS1_9PEZI|nr:hypothetical protein B0A55_12891 [Friedmanniomyces simplex]